LVYLFSHGLRHLKRWTASAEYKLHSYTDTVKQTLQRNPWVTLIHDITACSYLGKDVGRGLHVIFANKTEVL